MIDELKAYKQWVCYRADKIPLNPYTGRKADPTNPADWGNYEDAIACVTPGNGIGIGFVLCDSDPFTCIDLDDPTDPKHNFTADEIAAIHASHAKIAEAFNTYSEISPSGKGLHLWCKASLPSGKKSSERCVEMYSTARYMTVTGRVFHALPIFDRQSLAQILWEELGGASTPAPVIESKPQQITDDELCRMAATGANGNGELFIELWKNNWQPYFPSQSEADLTFCNIVAFYTDNKEQVARIYWASDLFKLSPKKKRKAKPDYLFHEKWGLVTKAFDQKGPELPPAILAAIQADNPLNKVQNEIRVDAPNSVLPNSSGDNWVTGVDIDTEAADEIEPIEWLPAPGLMGEVAAFIYNNAVNPVREVAIAASIAYLAGIAGRGYNISSTGLNHYVVLLANTSGGKEGAAQGMDKLTYAVREQVPAFERFIGPSDIASPQGLIKQLVETPCMLSHKGEFGMWLQKLTSKYARANETSMRAMLLDLFTKSGFKQTLRGSVYSDRQKNVPNIDSPAFSMFGDSTQQEFYKAIDEVTISEGLIPRLTVIESSDARPIYNESHNRIKPSGELVTRIAMLAKRALELEMLKTPIDIEMTPDAIEFHTKYREHCTDRIFADRENPIIQIWTRAHLRLLRLAGLVAVGCDPDRPVCTLEHLLWAHTVIEHGCKTVIERFNKGSVGEVNYLLEQRKLVSKIIYKFCHATYSDKWYTAYGISSEMFKARVVTHRYLLNNSKQHSCFRNDKNPQNAFRFVLQEFIEAGNIEKIDMRKVKDSGRGGLAYYVLDLRGMP